MSGEVLPRAPAPPPAGSTALKITLLTLLMAAPVAGAWFLLAPLPRWELAATGVVSVGGDSEVFIAADAWFAICGAAAGGICAVIAFFIFRMPSPLILFGLTGGGLAGAVGAWRLGSYLGPAAIDVQAQGLSVGERFDGPLELSALGVLLAWPLISVAVYFALVAGLVEPVDRQLDLPSAFDGWTDLEPNVDAARAAEDPAPKPRAGGRRRRPRERRGLRRS